MKQFTNMCGGINRREEAYISIFVNTAKSVENVTEPMIHVVYCPERDIFQSDLLLLIIVVESVIGRSIP